MKIKTTCSQYPKPYEIKNEHLILTEVLSVEKTEDGELYHVDQFIIAVKPRPNLAETVEKNYAEWLAKAKADEYNTLAESVRAERNCRLAETDYTCLADRQPNDAMIAYRQALRDITKQTGFPYEVRWPEI